MQGAQFSTFQGIGGSATSRILAAHGDVGSMRPWLRVDEFGNPIGAFVTVHDQRTGKPINVPVNNATLRKDEWELLDPVVIREARTRLVMVNMLVAAGLVVNFNAMTKTAWRWEDLAEFEPAVVSMDGATRGKKDRPNYEQKVIPLPFVHEDFGFTARELGVSRNIGETLDVTSAELATRQVAEGIEAMFLNGTGGVTYGGGTVYGLTNHPDINTYDITDWDSSAATGETILDDVRGMKQALINDRMYGPYTLVVPTNYETVLDDDFKANSDKTIRQRILEIENITDIMVADKLTSDTVVLFQRSNDVIRVLNGMAPTTMEWETEGGLLSNYKVLACVVPQVRSTQGGRSGIVKGS
jgi:uncharacterized linocin/CFP29 family protein